MNNKRPLVNLNKNIILVTRERIFCTTLFTNNNMKVVIQMHTFLMGQKIINLLSFLNFISKKLIISIEKVRSKRFPNTPYINAAFFKPTSETWSIYTTGLSRSYNRIDLGHYMFFKSYTLE